VTSGLVLLLIASACRRATSHAAPHAKNSFFLAQAHSSSLAISADGQALFVVNPEADSVSVLDLRQRKLEREISLAAAPPAPDASGNFTPSVLPRALALSPDERTLYVTGERSGALHVVDIASGRLQRSVHVGSEPIGILVSADGSAVFVACSADATVVRLATADWSISATARVDGEPWALAAVASGERLAVTRFLGPGAAQLDPNRMTQTANYEIPDVAARADRSTHAHSRSARGRGATRPGARGTHDNPELAHGEVRGLYDLSTRPGTTEVWFSHTLLGTDTPQPTLDFKSTAFPALSIIGAGASGARTLSVDAPSVVGIDGAMGDVVSGPHALSFTPDGDYALVADANSEDVLVFDAKRRVESGLVRPLPGKMPDGIVVSNDGKFAYVDERISGDVAVLRLTRSSSGLHAAVDGAAISRLSVDPMPAELRLGQELFNSANSSTYPITTDHWVACATCHLEGRSDAVTWKFTQGPRDTPTNAGGVLGTGFLFRTADRTRISDYWHTINIEQGGRFDPVAQRALLDALSAYVNHALPLPIPPTTNRELVTRGAQVFQSAGCATCHAGERFTDSGKGNPTLDLAGPVVLHDIGSCADSSDFPDVAHEDLAGHARKPCAFDTPSLNGVASTPPYLHDGSARTLRDAVQRMPNAPSSSADLDAIVEYLRSL